MAKKLMVLLGMLAMMLATAVPALAESEPQLTGVIEKPEVTTYQYGTHSMIDEVGGDLYALESDNVDLDAYVGQRVTVFGASVAGYEDGQVEGGPPLFDVTRVESAGPGGPPPGPMPGRSATLSFELAVECDPPAGATFFGNVQKGEGGPGIFAELIDPDGDGLYAGVATLPDRFAPGPAPEGTEPVSLRVQIVQGTGTRSAGAGTLPGEPTSIVEDFGVVPMEAENTFSAAASFCGDGTGDGGGNGTPVVSGDTNDNKGGTTTPRGPVTSGGPTQLPATGGLTVAGAIGAMLITGGLIARRVMR